ncbi:T9SS type A sorting domain-containing protein [Hymenobacter sp. BT186]|uniref:T9SS type A sorting domain-containing protein n=1 Tax=Hymenobacter telluris TaxID=2816474 RepID=A0A939F1I6_9BACT|nr:T9SS type A sorting domain-containing protein [Hymenobacter telluris]MBO0361037.1 T9SS type A sorting domain-containing protein [Hymenobacter telluris]MBW3377065.1 T9SS type A sorting domain-containing protein [Hymenobacter norwichensis]
MRTLLSALFFTAGCLLSAAPQATAQVPAPVKQWDKRFGGSGNEELKFVEPTSDGGYILGGFSDSPMDGDKTQASRGGYDYWLVKIDAAGTKQWDKRFGGSAADQFASLHQTSDGGYILGGDSFSGISGDKTEASRGINDYWVVKLDASGNKQWDKRFGSFDNDILSSVRQTSDGGYILGGSSNSFSGGDVTQGNPVYRFTYHYWVVKLDATGTKQWDRSFGNDRQSPLEDLQQTTDGGYILGGSSSAGISGDKTQVSQGLDDYWLVKLDASGVKQWDKTYGGADGEALYDLQQTSDGGYVLGGISRSGISGDKTEAGRGDYDYWVVKVDAAGIKQWDKTLGGSDGDFFRELQQTRDGGYIVGGVSDSGSSGDKAQANQGVQDYWIVKLSATGTKQWEKTLGGSLVDGMASVTQTIDGGYLLGGYSYSGISGDRSQANYGYGDYWVVKLAADPLSTTSASTQLALTAFPNPARTQFTLRGPLGTPYQLLNQLGQVVRAGQLSAQPLDVQALPAGLYLLRDRTTGRTTKLVKE